MEKIVKRDGRYYYGQRLCDNADGAYALFRADYHKELGKQVFKYLNRCGQRTERIHGCGFYREKGLLDTERFESLPRVPSYILGIVCLSYCRIFGCWDYPDLDDEQFDRWLDWALTRGSTAFYIVGRKQKTGRTSKKFNKKQT
ncbi:MAG: hypothetical protein II661_06230 [Bacteroidales bacterium]|nr:hypothetical protein [Bacteroidales bacterium]